jgi:hypothetical protein
LAFARPDGAPVLNGRGAGFLLCSVVGIAAFVVVGFVMLFTLIFVSLKIFNFQKRDRIDVFK